MKISTILKGKVTVCQDRDVTMFSGSYVAIMAVAAISIPLIPFVVEVIKDLPFWLGSS